MVETKDIFTNKKYPAWIKDHKIFKSYKQVAKVFPEIGLANCAQEIDIDNSADVKAAAKYLITDINTQITKRFNGLAKFSEKKADKIKPKRKAKIDNNQYLLNSLKTRLAKKADKCINTKNGKITLNLPEDVLDPEKKVVFKSGERLISAYNKMNDTLRAGKFLAMEKVENLPAFKEFSSKNVPAVKYQLVFSSDGPDGIWDIATMSMRGIQSCQTWGTGQSNDAHVVGSMVDPFTGIIYITSGAKHGEYGTKMIRRCVVRFVVSDKTKKPKLMLERMYPAFDKGTCDTFMNFLREKTGNKYEVIQNCYGGGMGANAGTVYVPISRVVESLDTMSTPYRDSQIVYKKDEFSNNTLDRITETMIKTYNSIGTKVLTAARAIKATEVPETGKKAFNALRGSSYIEDRSYAVRAGLSYPYVRSFLTPGKDPPVSVVALQDELVALKTSLNDGKLLDAFKNSCSINLPKRLGKIDDELLTAISTKVATRMSKLLDKEIAKLELDKAKDAEEPEVPVYAKLLS